MILAVAESLGTIHKFQSSQYWPVTKVSLQMLHCWLGHFWLSSFIPYETNLSVQLLRYQQCLHRLFWSLNAHLQISQVRELSRLFNCIWASRWPFCLKPLLPCHCTCMAFIQLVFLTCLRHVAWRTWLYFTNMSPLNVTTEMIFPNERLLTNVTGIWFLPCVTPRMHLQCLGIREWMITDSTSIRFITSVHTNMDFQTRLLPERFVTHNACKALLTVMCSTVHLEAAGISKHFFTHFTHKRLWIGM